MDFVGYTLDSHFDKPFAGLRFYPAQGERDGSQRRKTSFSND
jgi:hypothetical protein